MPSLCVQPTELSGVMLVGRDRHEDKRGFLSRLFCAAELEAVGFSEAVAQINQTVTRRRGAVRGLHFQYPPHSEIKLVTVLRGEIFDVAVDLRRQSPTFLRWHAQVLSADNNLSLLIPRGFAHGFQTLVDDCELLYVHSHPYTPSAESGLRPDDPKLAIGWPLAITELSTRDMSHPLITGSFAGIEL